jgi:hypothetical protein
MMALLSDYTAGTLTIAANDTAVTGSGTAWLAAGFGEGDVLIANGYFAVVGSVQSNTALTLAQPWRGGALSGAAYRLRYQGDGSRISAQARALVELLGGSGNLEALGKLAAGANQLPYFTGPGQMAATPLTAFARSLLDDLDASAALATLGVTQFIKALLHTADAPAARAQLGVDAAGINVAKSGDTMTGDLNVIGGAWIKGSFSVGSGNGGSLIQMVDTDEGNRYVHNNSGNIGFLSREGGWIFKVDDGGNANVLGNFNAKGNVSAGSAYLQPDGNIGGSVWLNWGHPDIYSAVGARIESRIASLFSGSFDQSGYLKLQNGLIIQWGRANTTANANVTLPFPIAFPNAVFSVVASNIVTIPDNNTFYAVSIDDPQRGSFNARGRWFLNGGGLGAAANLDFSFIAIGV